MGHVTDPRPADRGGIDRADGLDTGGRLQISMSPRQSAGQVVVALSGEIDMAGAAYIGAFLTAVAIRVPRLIVDLAGLEFSDCAGMRALSAAARLARQAGSVLVLAAPGPLVLRVLDLTGLMAGVPVYSSLEEAAGVPSPQRAARPVRQPDVRAIVAGLPLSGQDASRKKGSVGPHQQPTAGDTRPPSP